MNSVKSFEPSMALKFLSKAYICRRGSKCIHSSAIGFQKDQRTHYEVLEVKKDSTTKEIRNAFIKLSKENHPDKNQSDPHNHEKFVRINEAYSVLSQPSSRIDYDLSLPSKYHGRGLQVKVHRAPGFTGRPLEDFVIMETLRRARENAKNHEHYYGIKGVKKKSNNQVFIFLLTLSILAGFVQYFVVSLANSSIRSNVMQKTESYNMLLRELNSEAEQYGNRYVMDQILNEVDPKKANVSGNETEDVKSQ